MVRTPEPVKPRPGGQAESSKKHADSCPRPDPRPRGGERVTLPGGAFLRTLLVLRLIGKFLLCLDAALDFGEHFFVFDDALHEG